MPHFHSHSHSHSHASDYWTKLNKSGTFLVVAMNSLYFESSFDNLSSDSDDASFTDVSWPVLAVILASTAFFAWGAAVSSEAVNEIHQSSSDCERCLEEKTEHDEEEGQLQDALVLVHGHHHQRDHQHEELNESNEQNNSLQEPLISKHADDYQHDHHHHHPQQQHQDEDKGKELNEPVGDTENSDDEAVSVEEGEQILSLSQWMAILGFFLSNAIDVAGPFTILSLLLAKKDHFSNLESVVFNICVLVLGGLLSYADTRTCFDAMKPDNQSSHSEDGIEDNDIPDVDTLNDPEILYALWKQCDIWTKCDAFEELFGSTLSLLYVVGSFVNIFTELAGWDNDILGFSALSFSIGLAVGIYGGIGAAISHAVLNNHHSNGSHIQAKLSERLKTFFLYGDYLAHAAEFGGPAAIGAREIARVCHLPLYLELFIQLMVAVLGALFGYADYRTCCHTMETATNDASFFSCVSAWFSGSESLSHRDDSRLSNFSDGAVSIHEFMSSRDDAQSNAGLR